MHPKLLLLVAVFCAWPHVTRSADVVISEIMYHPQSENSAEEFVEIYHRGTEPFNLAGWRLDGGTRFLFPEIILLPGQYLVVAADLPTFKAKYPNVQNVVGGWEGSLSNTDEDINLDASNGKREDSVHYADEGDWAVRMLGPETYGYRGWIWHADHDGGGKSLELINPEISNKRGQNWGSSRIAGGTPGARNSIYATNIPPFILDVTHFPAMPKSTEAVAVTARIEDELATGIVAVLHYRVDGTSTFETKPMFDNGTSSDGLAGDQYFGALLPARPNNTIVEFYVEARDAQGRVRTWPAATQPANAQLANLLYQVRDSNNSGTDPLYLLILKQRDWEELDHRGGTLPDANSDAQVNGTFISSDQLGTRVQYRVGVRNRGHGSRAEQPNSFRVNFPADNRWHQRQALTLNSQFPHIQLLGSVLFNQAGCPTPEGYLVRLQMNNVDLARSGTPQFGRYIALETLNSDFVRTHFPEDSAGNLYRGVASDEPLGEAELKYRGTSPDPYRPNYLKQTNESEDDWTDLMELTRVMERTAPASYLTEVSRVVDVTEWLRYFALNALVDNNETTLSMGYGDDFAMYRGRNDPRFRLIPYDHDTILGQGPEPGSATAGVFRSVDIPAIEDLIRGKLLPVYLGHVRGLGSALLGAQTFNPLTDKLLARNVPAAVTTAIKTFAAQRLNFLRDSLPSMVPLNHSWKFNISGVNLASSWRAPNFDDAAWLSGAGLLANVNTSAGAPGTRTATPNGKITYYFRSKFNLDPALAPFLAGANLELSTWIDDGAIVYLNGNEILRLGMPEGAVSAVTAASRRIDEPVREGPFVVSGDYLVLGENVIAVELHQSDAFSSDAVFGLTLDLNFPPEIKRQSALVLNEVLANNVSFPEPDGTHPDWVELWNQSDVEVDLHEHSLTDNPSLARKWVFPEGSRIPANGFLVIHCDQTVGQSARNTGFGLSRNGDAIYLFDRPDRGGNVIDSIQFGLQPADHSIGRHPVGSTNWVLTIPTPGAHNSPSSIAGSASLRINEWMADPALGSDWFELYNPESAPVPLGGLFLSDNLNTRTQYEIPPLSFIGFGAHGYQRFEADSDPNQGPHHTSFKLNASGESLVLFSQSGAVIDSIIFGSQQTDVSEGRYPDGSSIVVRLPQATPASRNFVQPRIAIGRRGSAAVLWFSGSASQSYTVQFSDGNLNGPWKKLKDVTATNSSTMEVVDPAGGKERFYRLLTPAVQ